MSKQEIQQSKAEELPKLCFPPFSTLTRLADGFGSKRLTLPKKDSPQKMVPPFLSPGSHSGEKIKRQWRLLTFA